MLDKLDIDCYLMKDTIHLVSNSYYSFDMYSVTFELPAEIIYLGSTNAEIGSSVIRAAEKCRIYDELGGYNFDSVALALGYKSYSNLKRKSKKIHVSRRLGNHYFMICTLDKSRSMFDVSDEVQVDINDLEKIGESLLIFEKKLADF